MSKNKTKVLEIFLVIVSMLIPVVAVEAYFHYKGEYKPPSFPPNTPRPELYAFHESYGYRLHPSLETSYIYPKSAPRELQITSNSDGFRTNREFDEADSRPRVLILGDSFVFGEGVEAEERFTNLLEKQAPSWRVINMGMTGYGPDLMLRAFETLGPKSQPDLVLLNIYTDDFRRVQPFYTGAGFQIPRYALGESGQLQSIPYPEPTFFDNFRIVQAIKHVYWEQTKMDYRINEAILNRFLTLTRDKNIDIAITFLPGHSDTSADKERRGWLAQYALQHEIPYLDFTDAIHEEERDVVFIKGNWHYNLVGHTILATMLEPFLKNAFPNLEQSRPVSPDQ